MRPVLVDTSLWVNHLRLRRGDLSEALDAGNVVCHPFVIGELACGHLRPRGEILSLLAALEQVPCAEPEEVLGLVERRRLYGSGLGWIDVNLLASALLARVSLWTLDRRLADCARRLGIAATVE